MKRNKFWSFVGIAAAVYLVLLVAFHSSLVLGATTATLAPQPLFTALDANGDPYVGGKLYTYETGTTTPKSTWTDSTKGSANANPVILDSRGQADVWIDSSDGAYRFRLLDSSDVTIWTVDGIKSGDDLSALTALVHPDVADLVSIYDNSASAGKAISVLNLLGNICYPNYAAANHGVTGSSDTIKYCVDTIGSNGGIIRLRNNSGSARTEYALGTAETIGATIILSFEEGAEVKPGAAITLTLAKPENIEARSKQQIFDLASNSTTPVAFTAGGVAYPEWFGVDGTADDVPINAAVTALPSGTVQLQEYTYNITAAIAMKSNVNLRGRGDSSLLQNGANTNTIEIDADNNIRISDLKIDGQKDTYTSTVDTNSGIHGLANGTGSTGITIENVYIIDMAVSGIQILAQTGSHSSDVKIVNNRIHDSGAHGIITQDYVDDVLIQGNRVVNWGDTVDNRIAIASGQDSTNQQILGNYIESDGNEGGVSCHAISIDSSDNFVIASNIINGTNAYGIEVGFSERGVVSGNEIHGTGRAGITVIGDDTTSLICNNVSITGNSIYNSTQQGIYINVNNYVDDTHQNITVTGNNIFDAGNSTNVAIHVQYVTNFNVSVNTIVDAYKAAIYIQNADYGVVSGNMIKNANTSATAGMDQGVDLVSSTYTVVNGYLIRDFTGVSTSGTGEDTLQTLTIPQNYAQDWAGFKVKAYGIKTGSNGNKTLKFHWGSGAYTFNAAANDTNDWLIDATVLFNSQVSQRVSWLGWNGTTPLQGVEADTEDLSAGAIVTKITGECADASDSIIITAWMVELF